MSDNRRIESEINSNNTIVPSTPSWMTDQRQRRQNRRGYGRRYSGVGLGSSSNSSSNGIHSTASRNHRIRETPSHYFGALPGSAARGSSASTLDFDDDEEHHFLPSSSTVRIQGGRPPRPQQNDGHNGGGLDLLDEFELMNKPKKTRPNNMMSRPPQPPSRSRTVATVAKTSSSSTTGTPAFKFATPKNITSVVNSSPFDFESELGTGAECGLHEQLHQHSSMPDTPMIKMDADESRHHRRKAVMSSVSGDSIAPSSSFSIEENVHPNDSSGMLINNNSNSTFAKKGGARRSSRIGQLKARETNNTQHPNGVSGLSSSSLLSGPELTNSSNKFNSKKRSATEPTNSTSCELDQQSKLMGTRNATMASYSSGLFSKSTPSRIGSDTSTRCDRSESFSSLAQRCGSSQSWAVASNSSSSSSSSSGVHQSLEKQRSNSMACIQDSNNGFNSSNTTSNDLNTPSASAFNRRAFSHRSISCGDVLSEMKFTSNSPSLLVSSAELLLLQQQHQQGSSSGGTTLSTPTAASSASSSRKRRSTDVTSTSPLLLDEFDMAGGGSHYEQRTRSRKSSPSSPANLMHHDEVAMTTSSSVEPAVLAMSFFSPPPPPLASIAKTTTSFGWNDTASPALVDRTLEDVRDKLNDVSMISSRSDDDDNDDDEHSTNTSLSEDECDNDEDDEVIPREMTDVEIFESKSSYDDFKFLTKSLQRCTQSTQGKVASMGLNNGCVIALPPNWTFEHRASFSKWVAIAFGFRVGSVGGIGGSFLRCSDAEGKAVSDRLLRILNDYKNNRLELSTTNAKETSNMNESNCTKPKARLSIKLSSTRPACFRDGPSPFFDGLVEDLLTDDMKGITLDEKKTLKSHGNYSVPQFIRSMTLQPLANKIKNSTLPCFRSPVGENGRRSGGRRLLRLSSESAINGSDFSNQLHCMGSPSPLPNRFPGKRIREHASRAIQPPRRPSLQKIRSSFERPNQQQQACSKLFESPHPRNYLALEAPSSSLESVLETPMPKHIEHWGSRPISGKDWGESICCCDVTIDGCSRVFAKSWITSEFYDNEELCSEYHITLDEEEKSSLIAIYDSDMSFNHEDFDSEIACINGSLEDNFTTKTMSKRIAFARCDSVGASAFDLLHLDEKQIEDGYPIGQNRRRNMKLRKYARMSLFISAAPDFQPPHLKRCYRLSETPTKKWTPSKATHFSSITESTAISHVLSFLNEGDLIHSVSLVSTRFADVAAEALGNLMLLSVGCDPLRRSRRLSNESDHSDLSDNHDVMFRKSSVTNSMEKGWQLLMHQFPWAQFLSDGAFKRVYKVWNNFCGAYEAISVMDVDAIDDVGNLNLVGTELAVSVILSSLTKRNICPNFVVTRGVFTCQHEPPASLWGSRDDCSPNGINYDDRAQSLSDQVPQPEKFGNYQYIRMELCDNGDVEEFIRNHPDKMLSPWDCRNLLFQMAFALHVAADRFGLKHYDVKLLNFLLQSATDPTIAIEDHPHVVLRYGVGSRIFRLRMHPSAANIAKLADYGTAVMRSDTDGQPISLGQFTTLENTPPDFLILGNAAEQGYGHDSFGLGLGMLHLFTGNCPYEEILDEVVCPENLKGKLRSIWKQKSHNVIHSVIMDNNGNEDQTLYDTLYRFLVLFGIPENQFDIKKNGKVWHAINATLSTPTGRRRLKKCSDSEVYSRDRKKFSLSEGTDKRIADARRRLSELDGAMELLLSLVSFNPKMRATPLDVINSRLMAELIEDDNVMYSEDDIVKSYTAYYCK